MSPDEAARRLRHLAGDTEFKRDQEVSYSVGDLLEDLTHRMIALADELEGQPADPEDHWTPAYELTGWDELVDGHWV